MFTSGIRGSSAYPSNREGAGIGASIGIGILGTANSTNFIQQRIHRYATLIREGAFYLSLKSGRYLITQNPHWCRCKKERKQCKCRKSDQHIVKLTRTSSNSSIPEISARDFQELLEVEESNGNGAQVRLYLKTEQEMDPIQLSENRLLIEKGGNTSQEDDFLILRLDRSRLPRSTNTAIDTSCSLATSPIPTEAENYPEKPSSFVQSNSQSSALKMHKGQVLGMSGTTIQTSYSNQGISNERDENADGEELALDGVREFKAVPDQTLDTSCTLQTNTESDNVCTQEDLPYTIIEDKSYRSNTDEEKDEMVPFVEDMALDEHISEQLEDMHLALSPGEEDPNPFLCQSSLETVFEAVAENDSEVETAELSSPLVLKKISYDECDLVESTAEVENNNSSDIHSVESLADYPVESSKDKLPSIAEETKEDSLEPNEGDRPVTPTRSSNSIHTIGSLQSVSQPTTPLPHRRNFSNTSQTSTKNSIISLTSDADVRRSSHKVSKSLDIQRTPVSQARSPSEKKKKGLMNSLKRPVKSLTRSATGLFQHSPTSPRRRSSSSDQIVTTAGTSSILSDQASVSPTKEKRGILSSTKKFFRKRTVSMNV